MRTADRSTDSTYTTVLMDFDGVIRVFDPDHMRRIEQRHGVDGGHLREVAFRDDLGGLAITGGLTRSEWVRRIGEETGSPDAVIEWLSHRGSVDPGAVALIERLRSAGITVAILSNGTDTLCDELVELGIEDLVDHAFSTAFIGVAKPDPACFSHVCEVLGVDPTEVWFCDDTERNLSGAVALGMGVWHVTDMASTRAELERLAAAGALKAF